jgi:hypothetical protein
LQSPRFAHVVLVTCSGQLKRQVPGTFELIQPCIKWFAAQKVRERTAAYTRRCSAKFFLKSLPSTLVDCSSCNSQPVGRSIFGHHWADQCGHVCLLIPTMDDFKGQLDRVSNCPEIGNNDVPCAELPRAASSGRDNHHGSGGRARLIRGLRPLARDPVAGRSRASRPVSEPVDATCRSPAGGDQTQSGITSESAIPSSA